MVNLTEYGSGNVFADLGVSEPVEQQTKVDLAIQLNAEIDRLGISQEELARRLGVRQPNVSAIRNYRLSGFSIARLMEFVACLGNDVEILIRPVARGTIGRVSVNRRDEELNADAGFVAAGAGWIVGMHPTHSRGTGLFYLTPTMNSQADPDIAGKISCLP